MADSKFVKTNKKIAEKIVKAKARLKAEEEKRKEDHEKMMAEIKARTNKN